MQPHPHDASITKRGYDTVDQIHIHLISRRVYLLRDHAQCISATNLLFNFLRALGGKAASATMTPALALALVSSHGWRLLLKFSHSLSILLIFDDRERGLAAAGARGGIILIRWSGTIVTRIRSSPSPLCLTELKKPTVLLSNQQRSHGDGGGKRKLKLRRQRWRW